MVLPKAADWLIGHSAERSFHSLFHPYVLNLDMAVSSKGKEAVKAPPTRILVAEDSAVCRKVLEDALANQPYEVYLAKNGEEALAGFEKFAPDIMLLDWMMPGLSGAELCRIVRKSQKTYTYTILITSSTDRNRVVEGLDSGADDYLMKPVDTRELLARIRVGCRVIAMNREIEARNAQLEQAAHTDHLTGLPNRKAVEEFGVRQVHAAARQGFPVWVIVADLDKFKLVNDAHGHAAGDEAIKRFAAVLKTHTRSEDMAGRIGGDEFSLVVSYGKREAILHMVERLRADLAKAVFLVNGHEVQLTASFGIAGNQRATKGTFHELLIQADNALYDAKGAGGNQVRVALEPTNSHNKARGADALLERN